MKNFSLPCEKNKPLSQIAERIREDKEIDLLLRMSNVTAIDRLGFNDHGPTHVKIVSNSALQILRILFKKGVVANVVKDYKMDNDAAEVIVVVSAILHDIGHAIHRDGHELLSTMIGDPIVKRLLQDIYPVDQAEILRHEILHAIYSHEDNHSPLTIEGGVMKVADALDMEKGRARIPYQIGSINIHSLSALAIDKVWIREGEDRPIQVIIDMTNPAGIFQVDELLKGKMQTSNVENFFSIQARLKENGKFKILKDFKF